MRVLISPKFAKRFCIGMLFVTLCLTLAGLAEQFLGYLGDRGLVSQFGPLHVGDGVDKFDMDMEENIPTWFSSSALLLCSILLFSIALGKNSVGDRYTRHWWGLTIIFCLMSVEETAAMHELTIRPLRSLLDTGGLLFFTWVVFGAVFVLAFVLAYLRFVTVLPTRIRRWFIAAGAFYVAGALGMEMIGGLQVDLYGESYAGYAMTTVAEECLEMIGIVVFGYALMLYISERNEVRGSEPDNSSAHHPSR